MSDLKFAAKLALEALLLSDTVFNPQTKIAIAAIEEALAKQEQGEPLKKLQVTLEDRPIDIELAQYKRMFEAACSALGAVSNALGCDPEEGGAEPLLAAISYLKSNGKREPLTFEQILDLWIENHNKGGATDIFARAIEAAHGIKE